MLISRAPFRISFCGGGSDISVFYEQRSGAVLSTTIDKYIYLSIHPHFHQKKTLLQYSQSEIVDSVNEIKHPIFREVLGELWPQGGVEITSTADIPRGSGLGSSSTFTVALLHVLYAYMGIFCSKSQLAQKACEIEIDKLGEPIGKQDQYIAAYGGLNFIVFNTDGSVDVNPLVLKKEVITQLEQNLLIFYTGVQRNTGNILSDQNREVSADKQKFQNLSLMVELAYQMRDQLIAGDLDAFARSLHEGWCLKQTLSDRISDQNINKYYQRGLEYGAKGGKLVGAGGGGFLMFYCEPEHQDNLRKALFDLYELPFTFDWGGSKIIYVGENALTRGFVR